MRNRHISELTEDQIRALAEGAIDGMLRREVAEQMGVAGFSGATHNFYKAIQDALIDEWVSSQQIRAIKDPIAQQNAQQERANLLQERYPWKATTASRPLFN